MGLGVGERFGFLLAEGGILNFLGLGEARRLRRLDFLGDLGREDAGDSEFRDDTVDLTFLGFWQLERDGSLYRK